jgi:choline-sulfatase
MGKMHFSPIHSRHGFEVMRLCEHLSAQGLGPLAVEREDTVDDYHTWLVSQGLTDRRVESDGRAGHVPSSLPPEAHPTAWVEAEAASFLSGRDRERPMFLVISFPHPHAPYDPPEPYASMYDPADSVVPKVGYAANEQLPMAFQLATEASTTREAAADQHGLRRFLATVKGLVKQIDDSVGRLAASLDLESTVVFFTSDHGDYAGHRGLLRKNPWIPFDDLVRVPFFVSGADIAGGRRVDHLVQSCDLALTCLDYAGLAPPEGVVFDSRSLRPILEGAPRASDTDRAVFAATTVMWPMVRRGSYKYIEHGEHGKQGQAVLFDLEADPHETVNVADDAALAGVRDELVELLDRLLAQPVLDLMID